MAFARINAVLKSTAATRLIPVAGGRFGDSVSSKGHTFQEGHEGIDIYGGDGSRTVRAPTALDIIRVVDARQEDPKKPRGAAGPIWIDAYELDKLGSTTGHVLRFLHLSSVTVGIKAGSKVVQGQALGKYWAKSFNGNEGHLHFEVRNKSGTNGYGAVLNPLDWLRGGDEKSQVRIVCMLNQEPVYKGLTVGDTLYAESGQRLTINALPGYPWIQASVEDPGNISGTVTNDIEEAADWVLKKAKEESGYNWKKDGILGFRTWGDRIAWGVPLSGDKPIREQLDDAAKLPAAERYAKAWELRKEIERLRSQTVVEQTKDQIKDSAKVAKNVGKTVVNTVAETAGDVVGSLWDSIPTSVKVVGAIGGGIVVYNLVTKD